MSIPREIPETLASLFDDELEAVQILEHAGFPTSRRPPFKSPMVFWQEVCREIERGLMPSADPLLREAARRYPHREELAPWREGDGPGSSSSATGATSESRESLPTEVIMGDKYIIHGQAAAVGPGATASNNTFQQIYTQRASDLDLPKLAEELARLREAVLEEGKGTRELQAALEISQAADAARAGDGPKALERLKAAGGWVLDIATKIGTSVAVKAIQSSMGG